MTGLMHIYNTSSEGSAGDILIYLGIILTIGGASCFYQSYQAWRDAYNSAIGSMSLYTTIVGFILFVVGLMLIFRGYADVLQYLDTRHAYISDNEVPFQIFGFKFKYSLYQYNRAFDFGGITSLVIAIPLGLGIFITIGSFLAIFRKDTTVIPTSVHVWGVVYGIAMVIIFSFGLFTWLNYVAEAVFDGENIMNLYG
jgi:hypothetical protein